MDLTTFSLGDLRKLKANIEKEIFSREKKQRGKAMEEIKSVAAKYGLKLDDLVGKSISVATGAKSSGRPKRSAKAKSSSPTNAAVVAFRHPENPALTWSGGRGRRPQWVKDWEASGRSIEEARISAPGK